MKSQRKSWFEDFRSEYDLDKQTILQFHTTAGKGNLNYGVVMNREFVKTTSITQVAKEGSNVQMLFNNLVNKKLSRTNFQILESVGE